MMSVTVTLVPPLSIDALLFSFSAVVAEGCFLSGSVNNNNNNNGNRHPPHDTLLNNYQQRIIANSSVRIRYAQNVTASPAFKPEPLR